METSRFTNSELLKQVEQLFNVSIHQDTNYSDQSSKFYRFNISKDKNSKTIGQITCMNGKFEGGYGQDELLNDIANFMNKSIL